jgi:predicted esterase
MMASRSIDGSSIDPHAGQPVLHHGSAVHSARLGAILIHGRGGSPEDMIGLAEELGVPDLAYAAPSAAGGSWYPYSFLAPLDRNEPGLSSALNALAGLVEEFARQGIPHHRIAVLGFSQGACLSLEFAARHAQRYAAVIAFSGGLIGPPGTPRAYDGSLEGTPVFIGCSDVDRHIPVERVRESGEVFRRLGASVDERIYPGMGHTVNRDELDHARALLTV